MITVCSTRFGNSVSVPVDINSIKYNPTSVFLYDWQDCVVHVFFVNSFLILTLDFIFFATSKVDFNLNLAISLSTEN